MMAIGRYFVFMICVTATMSFPQKIKETDLVPFLLKILTLHNEIRLQHGVPILKLDDKLSKDSRFILDKIYAKQPYPKDKGVNIGNGTIEKLSDLNNAEAMKLFSTWYETGAEYNYKNGPTKEMAKKAAPFTQIVWKNTNRIGLNMAVKDDGTYDVVVIYFPKGNKKNQYNKNVLMPTNQK